MGSKNKGRAIFGLKKIPIEELLKTSRIEVGQLKAYIDELEDENEKLKNKIKSLQSLSRQERKQINEQLYQDNIYQDLRIKYESEHTTNKLLKRKVEYYFAELVKLRADNLSKVNKNENNEKENRDE